MANETNLGTSAAPSSGSIPRAVWIGGGVLCLVSAGLAGALINRGVDKPATASATTSSVTPTDEVAPPAKVAAVPAPAPAPAPVPARAAAPAPRPAPAPRHEVAVCRSCGVVQSVTEVREKGEGSGLGAIAGGVLGGVLGNQGGHGRGKTALTVLGAVGGGLAGNEVEKRTRGHTVYNVRVRMDDGSERSYQESNPISAGTHVVADGDSLRVR